MVLTEGFDAPAVDCIVLARPTQSRPLMAQMIGRGLRLYDDKTDCLIIDVVDNTSRHNLVTAWRFFGHDTRQSSAQVDDPYALRDRRDELIESARRQHTELTGKEASLQTIERWLDLLKPPPEGDGFNHGAHAWHHQPATEKQLAWLTSLGYDAENTDWTKGQAAAVINQQPASRAQLQQLLSQGYDVLTTQWTRGQAARILTPQFTVH